MSGQPFSLDAETRTLFLKGACLDILGTCRGMCCREWDVVLTAAEAESGRYETEMICTCDSSACAQKIPSCINRRIRLRKNDHGSCSYLTSENRCAIYDIRPKVCRDFSCKNGWKLGSVAPAPEKSEPAISAETASGPCGPALHGSTLLMANPLVVLKTVFFSPETGMVTLVKKPRYKCTVINGTATLRCRAWTDERIMSLVTGCADARSFEGFAAEAGKTSAGAIGNSDVEEMVQVLLQHQALIPVFA